MLFFENVIANNPDDFSDDELDGEIPPEESAPSPEELINQQMEPIKRYYLISELLKVQSMLKKMNYDNDILDALIKFSDNISYVNLTIIVPNLIAIINNDLKRLQNARKDSKERV